MAETKRKRAAKLTIDLPRKYGRTYWNMVKRHIHAAAAKLRRNA